MQEVLQEASINMLVVLMCLLGLSNLRLTASWVQVSRSAKRDWKPYEAASWEIQDCRRLSVQQ